MFSLIALTARKVSTSFVIVGIVVRFCYYSRHNNRFELEQEEQVCPKHPNFILSEDPSYTFSLNTSNTFDNVFDYYRTIQMLKSFVVSHLQRRRYSSFTKRSSSPVCSGTEQTGEPELLFKWINCLVIGNTWFMFQIAYRLVIALEMCFYH